MPPTILLVEDNAGDARLAKEALAEGDGSTNLQLVTDGAEALDYLERRLPNNDVPFPDLILLDLNLPKVNGRDVLKRIKESVHLRAIPVVVLTTSSSQDDIQRMYGLQANSYVTKPIDLDEFFEIVHQIRGFWLQLVTLPKMNENPIAS